jgi:murein DD-endopeptidase MepM/ murein hydrolase activator NlpD
LDFSRLIGDGGRSNDDWAGQRPKQGIGPLFERFVRKAGEFAKRGKVASRPHTIDVFSIDDDPFAEEPQHARWLLTTCIAAAAGTALVGATLLGVMSNHHGASPAFASLHPATLWDALPMPRKDDLGQVGSQPKTLAAKSQDLSTGEDQHLVHARAPAGGLSSQYPNISTDLLPYRAQAERPPAEIEGSYRVAALAPVNVTTIAKTPPPEPVDKTITVEPEGTLASRLVDLGVTAEAARLLMEAIEPVFPTRLLKSDQTFTVTLDKQLDFYGNEVIYPVRLSFSPGPEEEIVVDAELDGQFVARVQGDAENGRSRYVSSPHYMARAKIESSLYSTAVEEGVPPYIIAQMMQVFSFDVDFQRQIHPGDSFEAFYGNPLSGSSTNRKVLHYATLNLRDKSKTYYRFTTPDDGVSAYYDENGESANKSLMRTPVSGARITSNYGMRRHPILGYTRMHAGVDFGLPHGSPIKAAGAGTVTQAGRAGAYGITVRIDHQKGYETLYAHMSRIASGIKAGARVNQGQIIGYVGATGMATGPHLHYEVRVNGKPVNPMKVEVAGGRKLTGEMLAKFENHKRKLVAMMRTAPPSTQLAQID